MLEAGRTWWGHRIDSRPPRESMMPARHTAGSVAALLSAAGAAAFLLLALLEVDRLIGSTPEPEGKVASLGDIVGPLALAERDRWDRWVPRTDLRISVPELMGIHTWLDLAFVAAYLIGFVLLYRRGWISRVAVPALVVVVVADVFEDVTLFVLRDGDLSDTSSVGRWVVAWAATIKWVALLAAVIAVARNASTRARVARAVRLALVGLRWQRVTAAALGLLAVLSLVPVGDLFDQLPDVQRQWLDSREGLVRQFGWATASTVVFALAAFYIGRRRSERAHHFFVRHEHLAESPLLGWLAVPAAVGAVALVLAVTGPGPRWLDGRQLATFLVVLAAVAVVSVLLRWLPARVRARIVPEVDRSEDHEDRARAVRWTGDVLAVGTLVVGSLSLVRSMTAIVVLPGVEPERVALASALVVAAAVGVLVLPVVALAMMRRIGGAACLDVTVYRPRSGVVIDVIGGLLAAVVAIVFALDPIGTSGVLGVTATTGLLLATWIALLGLLVVHTQYHQPPELFRLVRLQATPVLTLVLTIGIANAWAGGGRDLHAVRLAPSTGAGLITPEVLLADWARRSGPCDRSVSGFTVRPMVLVAAAGGGIRASYWTENALRSLRADPSRPVETDCAANAPAVSSGVSGGSVGLVLSRGHLAGPDASTALSQPDALAAATAGLLDGDIVADLTGLRIPSTGTSGPREWRDRAALMEHVWERSAPDLLRLFPDGVSAPTGALVLNSTDAVSGCRVLVSQVAWGDTTGNDCDDRGPRVGASVDLTELLVCTPGLPRWSTAAMLSARFPFVTPAGRASSCSGPGAAPSDPLQLVDGGYAEGSGLGTLAEIAPTLMGIVQRHNAAVVGGSDAGRLHGAEHSIVVPIVLFLENHFGDDVSGEVPEAAVEAIVPLEGTSARGLQASTDAWLQRLASTVANPCSGAADDACQQVVDNVRGTSRGVVVIAPFTQPAITAPLGWVLSEESRSALSAALPAPGSTSPRGSHGELAFLQSLLRNQQ